MQSDFHKWKLQSYGDYILLYKKMLFAQIVFPIMNIRWTDFYLCLLKSGKIYHF